MSFSCSPVVLFPGTCEDYHLLENMNKLTSLKYMEMKDISINISRNLQDLNHKCMFISPSDVTGTKFS